MNKKVLRAGAVSAVAAGIGAAAVMAGKRRSKKEEENSDSVRTESQKGISRDEEKEEYFNCKWWKHRCGFCQRIFKRKTV